MNANKRRVALFGLGYIPAIDGYTQPCWCKDRTFYTDAEVDEILKKANKWEDDFDIGKITMI